MTRSPRLARQRSAQRLQSFGTVLKLMLLAGIIAATGFYAYRVGIEVSRGDTAALQEEIERLRAAALSEREAAAGLRVERDETRALAERYRLLVDETRVSDEVRELIRLVQAKLKSGLDKDRLALFISAAERPRRCEGPATKRFMVRTPGVGGEASTVRFGNGLVISANGIPATDAAGKVEHWFDPAQPVDITITGVNGEDGTVSGYLPLRHTLITADGEHRFAFSAGTRGFIEATGDHCALTFG